METSSTKLASHSHIIAFRKRIAKRLREAESIAFLWQKQYTLVTAMQTNIAAQQERINTLERENFLLKKQVQQQNLFLRKISKLFHRLGIERTVSAKDKCIYHIPTSDHPPMEEYNHAVSQL